MYRAAIAFALFFALSTAAAAAELQIWTARAGATVLWEIGPEFERSTGHKLVLTTGLPSEFMERLERGEQFDIMISTATPIDALIERKKINPETRTALARSGIGMQVRTGARKPDISTVDAFKRTLLDAKSIAYLKIGSGLHLDRLLDRFGIADKIKPKAIRPDTDIVSDLVANGEAELGIVVITQILTSPGVDYVGPLPQEIQSYVSFVGGVSSDSKAPDAAKDLLKFLTGPRGAAVMKAQGMEPSPTP
jgi:molybdate transport system substrate-binding protein